MNINLNKKYKEAANRGKNTITEIKCTLEGINRLDDTEDQISDL